MASGKRLQSEQRPDDDRARKTLYVTGFNSKHTTKHLLKELFLQGGPVTDVILFDTHAYIRFEHEESVPYCLALFNEVELFGDKLRLNPRYKSANTFSYMKYLSQVRTRLRDEYMSKEPPKLPAKKYPDSPNKSKGSNRTPIDNDKRRRRRRETDRQLSAPSNAKQGDRMRSRSRSANMSDTTVSSAMKMKANKTKRGRRGGQKRGKQSKKIVKTLKR